MGKIAIVYWSGTGNTEAMANFVAEGAGGQADLFTPGEFSADLISSYSALAFGCPSMGAEQLEEAEFEPMFEAVKPRLSGKTIGLFGSYGWGDGEWMRTWAEDCESAGCNLVSEPVICNEAPDDAAAESCRALGGALAAASSGASLQITGSETRLQPALSQSSAQVRIHSPSPQP